MKNILLGVNNFKIGNLDSSFRSKGIKSKLDLFNKRNQKRVMEPHN